MDKVFAKSKDGETLEKHTRELINNYRLLKKSGYLNEERLKIYDQAIEKIMRYHDLGKLNHKFQNKIKKSLNISERVKVKELKSFEELPHEWLSLAFISKEDRNFFKSLNRKEDGIRFNNLVRYCIAFHHSRNKPFSKKAYQKFVELDLEKNKSKLGLDYELNSKIDIDDVRQKVEENFEKYFELLVFLKGLLHKCDYSASGGIEAEKPYTGDYKRHFEAWLNKKAFVLRDFQKEARQDSDKSVVLVASTGIGKTEYSMNWIDGSKAFYLLGIRTAVNEMYKRFKKTFGSDNVSLLHGETAYFLADETDEKAYDSYFQNLSRIKQFCFPITIATADQLVAAAFKYNGFELVYLTASYSKIVMDEIQSFSPESIAVIVVFLKEAHKLGGRFLLMTATLPPFIRNEFKSLGPDVTFPNPALSDKKRHRVTCVSGELGGEETLNRVRDGAGKSQKILVVANTVRKAQELCELLKDFEPKLLHSRFIRKDRKIKEEKIMEAAEAKSPPCLWVATQIVEASLDIDFDLLITECSTVDSLFQRFGRCYRKRELKNAEPNIYIFKYDALTANIYDPEITRKSWEALNRHDGKLIDELDKQEIINEVFSDLEETGYFQKYKDYKELLKLGFRAKNKNEAQKFFRKISNSHLVIPDPVYKKNKTEIDSLINAIDGSDLKAVEKIKKKGELLDWTISAQIYKKELLKPPPLESDVCDRLKLKLIKGTEYDCERGLTFIKGYKDYDNFIW